MLDQKTGKRVPPFDREDHIWMMKNQDEWPLWPRLPLKHPERSLTAVLFGSFFEGDYGDPHYQAPIVVCGLLFDPEILGSNRHLHFETVEEIVDAGWVVD